MRQTNATGRIPTRIGRHPVGYHKLAERLGVSPADISNYVNNKLEKIGRKRLERIEAEFTKNQKSLILEDLLAGESITPISALNRYGCFRLAARIADLRKDGWDIETDRSNHYATYRLGAS